MRSLSCITLAALLFAGATTSSALADVHCGGTAAVRVGVAPPPPLPETDQPPMPAYGYEWTPGSWAWNPDINDYYWTPGTWILPPAIGLFWTPGYWAWDSGVYVYRAGYWGPHVGFYGGVRYGFGYWGHGYDGGYWRGRTFYYNRAYNNIGGLHINALYDRRVPEDRLGSRTSYNGGRGGVVAAERADERLADRDKHIAATSDQARHFQSAAGDPALRASVNHGHPMPAAAGAAHVAAAHMAGPHDAAYRAEASRAGAHTGVGHEPASHMMHAPSPYRQAAAPQPHHETSFNHFAPAYGRASAYGPSHFAPTYGRAPAYVPQPRVQAQPFRPEPQRWEPPRPGPMHQEAPHVAPSERPHPPGGREA